MLDDVLSLAAPEVLALPAHAADMNIRLYVRELLLGAGLTDRQSQVIRMRYGIECDERSRYEIAEILGVSYGRTCQIEMKAVRRMKEFAKSADAT